jgi:hypothetical protein
VDVEQIIPVSSNKRHCTAVLSTSSASIASLADDIDTLSAQAKPHRPPVIKPQLPPIATPTTTATAAAAEATDIKPKPRPKSVAAFNTASATKTHSSTPSSTKTHSSTPPSTKTHSSTPPLTKTHSSTPPLTKTHSSTPPSTKTPPTSTHSAAKQLNTSSAAFLAAAAKAAAKAAASCNAVSSVPKSLQAAAATRSASTHPVLERLRTKAMQEATAARKLSHQEQAQYHVEYTNQLKASCSNTPKRTVFVARVAGSAVSAVTRNAMLDRLIQLYSSAASEASDIDAIHRKV